MVDENTYYRDRFFYLRQNLYTLLDRLVRDKEYVEDCREKKVKIGLSRPDPISLLKHICETAFDENPDGALCLDNCKNLYFCMLTEGHEGPHQDGMLVWGE